MIVITIIVPRFKFGFGRVEPKHTRIATNVILIIMDVSH